MNIFRKVRKPKNSLLDKIIDVSKEEYFDCVDYFTAVLFCYVSTWGMIDMHHSDYEKMYETWWFESFHTPLESTTVLAERLAELLRGTCRSPYYSTCNSPLLCDFYVLMGAYPGGELSLEIKEEYVKTALHDPSIYWSILGIIAMILGERNTLLGSEDLLLRCKKQGYIPEQVMKFSLDDLLS